MKTLTAHQRMLSSWFCFLLPSAAVAGPIHWDLGLQAGAMRRFLSDRANASDATFGPVGELHGHVALLPLVRVGAYLYHDISPSSEGPASARQITTAGVRVKVAPPWPRGVLHGWVFVGVGYALVYAPSYMMPISPTTDGLSGVVSARRGGFLELPAGVGLGYKFWKPWEITAELAGRWGLLFSGSTYESRSGPPLMAPGKDVLSLSMMLGIGLEL